MDRIKQLFESKKGKVLSIFFTAGHPKPNSILETIQLLEKNGVDMVEIGIPYSDPLADGPIIQKSSTFAIQHGMTLDRLLDELKTVRETVSMPLILMGYLNPILQFGVEKFCATISKIGIDGVILPDMPIEIYEEQYRTLFERNNIKPIFLITPGTSPKRIERIAEVSKGFIYVVSSASTTGSKENYDANSLKYLEGLTKLNIKQPLLTGFGISTPQKFKQATAHTQGGIIGSAFIQAIEGKDDLKVAIDEFVKPFKLNA